MELNNKKGNIFSKLTFYLSILLWSFLNFALLKLLFETYNNAGLFVAVYSMCCYLFWIYYFINSGKLLDFWELLFSYALICTVVFSFHRIYNAVFVVRPRWNYDDNIIVIFGISAIPLVILFFVGNAIFKAVKPT